MGLKKGIFIHPALRIGRDENGMRGIFAVEDIFVSDSDNIEDTLICIPVELCFFDRNQEQVTSVPCHYYIQLSTVNLLEDSKSSNCCFYYIQLSTVNLLEDSKSSNCCFRSEPP
jgi:hypothetical protein